MTRRTFAAAALALVLAGQLAAQATFPPMHPKGMRVGNTGEMRWRFVVAEKISDTVAICHVPAYPDLPVIIKGGAFAGLADGSELTLPGEWKVSGTEKRDGRTLFVVEPAGKPKR